MKANCKHLILMLVLFLSIGKIFAQGNVPPPYRGDYNRMMSNMAMNQANMNMQRMMNQRLSFGTDYLVNEEYDYNVLLKDKSTLLVSSKIYTDTVKHKTYLLYTNKKLKRSDSNRIQKIYPDQTVKVTRINKTMNGAVEITGTVTDSCWLFKIIDGKINAFSHLSEVRQADSYYLRAIQIGNGAIQKIDSVGLASAIQTNPKAMKAFLKNDYYKAIQKFNDTK